MTDVDSGLVPSSPLGGFLRALFEQGEITVARYQGESPHVGEDVASVLSEAEAQVRAELAGDPPTFLPHAAAWATLQFYRACQFSVSRDVPPKIVLKELSREYPGKDDLDTFYSVDLIFRFLPDLYRIVNRLAPEDVLLGVLRTWAHRWPLSSVGIRLEQEFSIEAWAGSFALLRLYCDRITAEDATDRVRDTRVRRLLQADLGLHHEHFPSLHRLLRPEADSSAA